MALCMVLVLPTLALAQQRRGGPPDMDAVMAELTQELELSSEQAGAIRELLEAQNTESRKLMEEARASGRGREAMAGMRERMTEIREATNAEVRKVLTEEQAARYEALQAERMERRRRGPGGPPGGP